MRLYKVYETSFFFKHLITDLYFQHTCLKGKRISKRETFIIVNKIMCRDLQFTDFFAEVRKAVFGEYIDFALQRVAVLFNPVSSC